MSIEGEAKMVRYLVSAISLYLSFKKHNKTREFGEKN